MASHKIRGKSASLSYQAFTCAHKSRAQGPTIAIACNRNLHTSVFKHQSRRLIVSRQYSTGAKVAEEAGARMALNSHSSHDASRSHSLPKDAGAETQPVIHHIFEKITGSWQYIVADPATAVVAIIDPVLDLDPVTSTLRTDTADELLSLIRRKGYTVEKILETHIHADHVTAAAYLQSALRDAQGFAPTIGIGKRIEQVQALFQKRYGIPEEEIHQVHQCLLDDDEIFHIGNLQAQAIHLPGHTPDHMGYKIGG